MGVLTHLILSIVLISKLGNFQPDILVGGVAAYKGEFPFFAQLKITLLDNGVSTCGAALIHPKWILTAAHCFNPHGKYLKQLIKRKRLEVYMGTNMVYDQTATMNWIKHVVPHPGFYFNANRDETEKSENNVAVAKLRRAYQLNQYIQTVFLPLPRPNYRSWTTRCKLGWFMGAGVILSNLQLEYSNKLLYASAHSKIKEDLGLQKPSKFLLDSIFYTEIQWLQGPMLPVDPGGPFVCYYDGKPVVYGTMSGGSLITTIQGTTISIYEEIDKHMNFIRKTVPIVQIFGSYESPKTNN